MVYKKEKNNKSLTNEVVALLYTKVSREKVNEIFDAEFDYIKDNGTRGLEVCEQCVYDERSSVPFSYQGRVKLDQVLQAQIKVQMLPSFLKALNYLSYQDQQARLQIPCLTNPQQQQLFDKSLEGLAVNLSTQVLQVDKQIQYLIVGQRNFMPILNYQKEKLAQWMWVLCVERYGLTLHSTITESVANDKLSEHLQSVEAEAYALSQQQEQLVNNIRLGHVDKVQSILKESPKLKQYLIHLIPGSSTTYLHLALECLQIEPLNYFLENKLLSPDIKDGYGNTFLQAVQLQSGNMNLEYLESLLELLKKVVQEKHENSIKDIETTVDSRKRGNVNRKNEIDQNEVKKIEQKGVLQDVNLQNNSNTQNSSEGIGTQQMGKAQIESYRKQGSNQEISQNSEGSQDGRFLDNQQENQNIQNNLEVVNDVQDSGYGKQPLDNNLRAQERLSSYTQNKSIEQDPNVQGNKDIQSTEQRQEQQISNQQEKNEEYVQGLNKKNISQNDGEAPITSDRNNQLANGKNEASTEQQNLLNEDTREIKKLQVPSFKRAGPLKSELERRSSSSGLMQNEYEQLQLMDLLVEYLEEKSNQESKTKFIQALLDRVKLNKRAQNHHLGTLLQELKQKNSIQEDMNESEQQQLPTFQQESVEPVNSSKEASPVDTT